MTNFDERRQYYRINDDVSVSFTHINPLAEIPDLEQLEKEIPVSFRLVNELQQIESEAKKFLGKLQSSEPEVALYLRTLDKRIESLGNTIVKQHLSTHHNRKAVSLSGSGLKVIVEKALPIDSLIIIEMLLPDTRTAIRCYGKVVSCTNNDSKFDLAINFERIREVDRDAIVHHIMKQESRQIRKKHRDQTS